MRMNRVEFALVNNPVRVALQKHFEAKRLLGMGGALGGGLALEMGCGRGVGAELILDRFGADAVHAFDLDPRMIAKAKERLAARGSRARLWVGSATAIPSRGAVYDAVFDFGIIHHIRRWRAALIEVERVLKPGGIFYAEEVLAPAIRRTRMFLDHPQEDRFDAAAFRAALSEVGLVPVSSRELWQSFAWFVAMKTAPS